MPSARNEHGRVEADEPLVSTKCGCSCRDQVTRLITLGVHDPNGTSRRAPSTSPRRSVPRTASPGPLASSLNSVSYER